MCSALWFWWLGSKLRSVGVHLPSCAVPGEVLSSCGVGTPALFCNAVRLFGAVCLLISICGLGGNSLVVFEASSVDVIYETAPLQGQDAEPPFFMQCLGGLLSSFSVWAPL